MSTGFIPRDFSLSPIDLIPLDEYTHDEREWREYCKEASKADRYDILLCVLSALDSENSPLYDLIDSAIQEPHEPGRARESITVLQRVGQRILDLVASAVDESANLRLAVKE